MASKTGDNDKGWWADSETVDPPYLNPEPGQIGASVDRYGKSLMGFPSGAYPNGDPCPDPDYVWRSTLSGEETDG